MVDDDDSVRRSLARLLRAAGFGVETFATAEDYVATASPDPACLIIDMHLPGMDGIELQRRLEGRLPVVAISGYGEELMRQESLDAGAAAFLDKPFANSDLLEAIDRAIDRP